MTTIHYRVGNTLYLNITNRCPCRCTFCIRIDHEGVGDGESLWLDHEPSTEEVIDSLRELDLASYDEAVFCGYGEPTERLDVMLETCRYIRSTAPQLPIRLNTNGLGDLIHKRKIASEMSGLLDRISVSLNAPDKERYLEVTRPSFGEESFEAMLAFAKDAQRYVPEVFLSVVDVISPEEIAQSQKLADRLGIPLRVRAKS